MLKVEFDDADGFRSNFLTDLSEGGVRINTSMEIGQRILLNISFLGFVEPVQIPAVVQWSLRSDEPEGPASGLAFVDMSPEARTWLAGILGASTQLVLPDESSSRVLLLEPQPFLRDVYGQEVRNWAELRDEEEPLELIGLDDPQAWLAEATRAQATLGILDIDELPAGLGLELYGQIRASSVAMETPLIIIGSPAKLKPFLAITDELLLCLNKPLRFGVLMNTVRILARDINQTVLRSRSLLDD